MMITIEKIIYPGISLAKENGKIIFADQGLPQEQIQVKITDQKKDYVCTVAEKILKPSPHRINPKCDHYKICSNYQYIDYPMQLKIKNQQLKEIFTRSSEFKKIPIKQISPCKQPWNYRNKLHLHIIKKNNICTLAYHQPKSPSKFVEIKNCFLGMNQTNRFLKNMIEIINELKIDHLKEIIVRENQDNQLIVSLIGQGNSKSLFKRLKPLSHLKEDFSLAGIIYSDKKTKQQHLVFGKNHIIDKLDLKKFSYGPESFFQINIPMLNVLINDLKRSIAFNKTQTVVDLYCGVGLFAIVLSDNVKNVFAVDSSKQNHFFLNKNIKSNKAANVVAVESDCNSWALNLKQKNPDIVIVDPPRRGLENRLIKSIVESKPEYVAYVSCDPITLIRDLKNFSIFYTISDLFSYDFFPQTGHIECLAILKRS
jgi:23S rRNA (uracil1939-C5)-methyltransferase